MTGPMPTLDRRREVRKTDAGLMNWLQGDRPHWGLLNDSAHESVAFVTKNDCLPAIGERIEIERSTHPKRSYRVTRVAPFERTLVLVACESDWLD